MGTLTVKRSVAVHVIVTDEFKEELKTELRQAAETAQQRIDQLEFQSRRFLADLQRNDMTQAMSARRQIEAEKRRQDGIRRDIKEQLEQADKLEIGSEYPRGVVEGSVEIKEGDNLVQKLSESQIVIKDGVIVEIREV